MGLLYGFPKKNCAWGGSLSWWKESEMALPIKCIKTPSRKRDQSVYIGSCQLQIWFTYADSGSGGRKPSYKLTNTFIRNA